MKSRLGQFVLRRPLGEGAMGVVYEAIHEARGVRAAVKVDRLSADPRANAAFLHEIQITAALDHPNIVMVLDHGVVDGVAHDASGGVLPTGARWLAMELATGGTAAGSVPNSWPQVLQLVRGMLDGLAHAHSRGVLHRDLKLQNVLLAGQTGSLTPPTSVDDARIVLSDFGISDLQHSPLLRSDTPVGTPEFMAPELIEGRWRDQGPWTDLYAVGVILWLLTVRNYPFLGEGRLGTYRAHLDQPVPRFSPLMPVPRGLGPIIRALLSKDPADRPEYAAELRRQLDDLGLPVGDDDETTDFDGTAVPTIAVPDVSLKTNRSYAGRSQRTLGPVPLLHGGRPRDASLEQAGLALFGLRRVPFVGRESECDALWSELVRTRATSQPHVVLLTGPTGIGKTRLADWLRERVHELGVGATVRVRHQLGSAAGDALREALRVELGTTGLGADDVVQRLAVRFPTGTPDARALAAMLEPHLFQRPPVSAAEQRQLAIAVFAQIATTRPVVLQFDDIHLDSASMRLVDALLDSDSDKPILAVATLRGEELADDADVTEIYERLKQRSNEMIVGPIPAEFRSELIQGMLDLDGELATRIERKTDGNPQFAKQLIGAWIEQRVLQAGPNGFRVAPTARATMPRVVQDVWKSRLFDALSDASEDAIEALQIAAAWGIDVDTEHWHGACSVLGIQPDAQTVDSMRKRHLIHLEDPRGSRWRFVHGAIRELLVSSSKEGGAWQRHNLGIAVWLNERPAGTVAAKRLARHYLRADVPDAAIAPLCEAINDQLDAGDLRSPGLVTTLGGVLERLGLAHSSPEWVEWMVLRALRERGRGQLHEAEALVRAGVVCADQLDLAPVKGKSHRELARVLWARGEFNEAIRHARTGRQAFESVNDEVRAADCWTVEGSVLCALGRFDEAEAAYLSAIEAFAEHAPGRVPSPMIGMVRLFMMRGDPARMREWLLETKATAEPLGMQISLAVCANLEGELARAGGHLVEAAAAYRDAVRRYRAVESPDFVFSLVNLGIIEVCEGLFEDALSRTDQLLRHTRRHPNELLVAFAHMVRMAALAGLGQAAGATQSLSNVRLYVTQSGLVEPDLALMAEKTAALLRATHPEHARDARTLAVSQYEAAGRHDDARRLQATRL